MTAFAPIETLEHRTPLGLRLLDDATGTTVADDLDVRVLPLDGSRALGVFRTPSGIFAAGGARALREWETREIVEQPPDAPRKPAAVPVRIEVRDRSGRFHSFAITRLELPHELHSVPLFSTAARSAPLGMAAVRASLRLADGGPAAYHGLEVTPPGATDPVRGIADRRGEIVVLLPYPQPTTGSPPSGRKQPLTSATWTLDLRALRPRATAVDPEPGSLPDVQTFLEQSPATLRKGSSPTSNELTEATLEYGRELVLRPTPKKSELFVHA